MTGGAEIHPEYAREALGDRRAQPRVAAAARRGRAGVLLRRVPVRLLLSARAEHERALEPAPPPSVKGLRDRDPGLRARKRRRHLAGGLVRRAAANACCLARRDAAPRSCLRSRRSGSNAPSTQTSASVPGDGSFAEVFVGWTGVIAVNILAVVYWLWILLAESLGTPRSDAGADPSLGRGARRSTGACSGLIEVTAFVLLYIVA